MKRTILILTILTVGMIHSQAQIGKYYRTVFNKYQQTIIESDSTTIVLEDNGLTSWHLFEKGICTDVYFTTEGLTKELILKSLSSNETFIKSELGDWWYFYVDAANGKRYHAIAEVWHNKEGRIFEHIYLNKEI